MPKRKPVVQYATLDVLLMYLLGYKQKVVRIRKDAFDYHSYWFSKQPLRCVAVEIITDKQGKQWVVLTRRNQQAIQNHLTKFFVLYHNGKVKTPYYKVSTLEWNWFLREVYNWNIIGKQPLHFSFFSHGPILTKGSDACAFHCITDSIYGVLHIFDNVVSFHIDEEKQRSYITFGLSSDLGKQILLEWFGCVVKRYWRVSFIRRKVSYKGHEVKFGTKDSKQKKLLMLLLKNWGRVSVHKAISELGMSHKANGNSRNNDAIRHALQDIANQIHKKAFVACEGSKDKPTFQIEVDREYIEIQEEDSVQ